VLSGVTVAIVAYDELGATGGPNGDAFMLAVTRASEISIGIVSAGIVLAATDFGGVRRQLAALIASLSAEIVVRFSEALSLGGAKFPEFQEVRGALIRRVIALDPIIDQAYGEAAELHYRSPVIQSAIEGRSGLWLIGARPPFAGTTAGRAGLPRRASRVGTQGIAPHRPRSMVDKLGRSGLRHRRSGAACRRGPPKPCRCGCLPIRRPTRIVGRSPDRRHSFIPDLLPSLVNAGHTFVTVGAVELFWTITQWPNGSLAILFATIGTILFAVRANQAYATAVGFIIGTVIAAMLAATVKFAILPQLESFPAFCLAIGIVLVPAGIGSVQPWQTATFTAMAFYFMPLLAPQNEMSYDTAQFYNNAVAIVGGLGAAAVSFRLLPPLSLVYQTRRLLALMLRDLRRLMLPPAESTLEEWRGRGYARLAVLPAAATREQTSNLLAALLVGSEITRVRCSICRFSLGAGRTLIGSAACREASGRFPRLRTMRCGNIWRCSTRPHSARHAGRAEVHLARRSGLTMDGCQWRARLLRLLHQLPDRLAIARLAAGARHPVPASCPNRHAKPAPHRSTGQSADNANPQDPTPSCGPGTAATPPASGWEPFPASG
jgi:hypothetical protein